MNFQKLCFLFVILLGISQYSNAKVEVNEVLKSKPYFSVYIESSGCDGDVSINRMDIAGLANTDLKVEVPVNDWIKEGENEIGFFLFTDETLGGLGGGCSITATLRVREFGSSSKSFYDIMVFSISGERIQAGEKIDEAMGEVKKNSRKKFIVDKTGDVHLHSAKLDESEKDYLVYTRAVTLPEISLPRWAYFDSENITKFRGFNIWGRYPSSVHEQLIDSLWPFYERVWQALKDKNPSSIVSLFDERNRETDSAFYRAEGESKNELFGYLEESLQDDEIELDAISKNDVWAHVYDNNQLVRLERKNGDPLIRFSYKDKDINLAVSYNIVFRKQGDKWVITR